MSGPTHYRAVSYVLREGIGSVLTFGQYFEDAHAALDWCKATNAAETKPKPGEGRWFVQVAEWRELEMSDLT